MNYDANATHWQKGDLVIHDCDAKKPEMLMVVEGYDAKTGEVKTRYVRPQRYAAMRGVFRNDLRYLHDPKRFNIEIPAVALAVARGTKGEERTPRPVCDTRAGRGAAQDGSALSKRGG